ncbi:MAG: hypothetical protein ABIS51_18515 [Sphingomonas sp.]
MRGQLNIASARSPYLRAGLSWASRDALSLYIRELDGARLMELAQDPVLTVSLETADGRVAVLRFVHGETVDTYAELIRSFPEQPSEPNALPFAGTSALDDIALAVGAAGFASVDKLISAHSELRSELASTRGSLETALGNVTRLEGELLALKTAAPAPTETAAPTTPAAPKPAAPKGGKKAAGTVATT